MTAEERNEQIVSEAAAEPENKPQEAEPAPEKPQAEAPKAEEPKQVDPEKKATHPFMNNQYMVLPTGSYFWSMFIFGIPVLGWFICLIVALGGSHYRNKIHFARAFLLYMLLCGVLWTLLFGFIYVVLLGGSLDMLTQFDSFLTSSGVGYPTDMTHLSAWVEKLEAVPSVHDFLAQLNTVLGL